jgi:hypothetical protein
MNGRESTSGSHRLKIVAVMFFLAVASSLGSYAYHLYGLIQGAKRHLPQLQIERLIKDFRRFYLINNRFPQNFVEINDKIWRTNPKPDYGIGGEQARTKNYYYFYTSVNARQFTLWAVPTGPRRTDVDTYFVVATKEWIRIWRGKAIEELAISTLPSVPTENELSNLGLSEQASSK